MDDWTRAYLALQERVRQDERWPTLVRATAAFEAAPRRGGAARRLHVIATQVCERLGLDPAIYRGNVIGAAVEAVNARRVTVAS